VQVEVICILACTGARVLGREGGPGGGGGGGGGRKLHNNQFR